MLCTRNEFSSWQSNHPIIESAEPEKIIHASCHTPADHRTWQWRLAILLDYQVCTTTLVLQYYSLKIMAGFPPTLLGFFATLIAHSNLPRQYENKKTLAPEQEDATKTPPPPLTTISFERLSTIYNSTTQSLPIQSLGLHCNQCPYIYIYIYIWTPPRNSGGIP